jgi:uncharacterized membrane protein
MQGRQGLPPQLQHHISNSHHSELLETINIKSKFPKRAGFKNGFAHSANMILETIAGFVLLLVFLFVPGYFLSIGIFAKKSDLEIIERLAFSFILSIVFMPLLTLAENTLLMIPINYFSVTANFLILIIAGLALWFYRTKRLPDSEAVQLVPKF